MNKIFKWILIILAILVVVVIIFPDSDDKDPNDPQNNTPPQKNQTNPPINNTFPPQNQTKRPSNHTEPPKNQTEPPVNNTALPKGSRILAIDLSQAQDMDFGEAFSIAKDLGIELDTTHMTWSQIEVSEGVYEPNPDYLTIANAFYPTQNTKLSFTLGILDTGEKFLPTYLEDKDFDDPETIQAGKNLLDHIFTTLQDTDLEYISIGNEIDISSETELTQYTEFYRQLVEYAKTKTTAKIGSKATLDGLVEDRKELLLELNQHSDVIMVTHYPKTNGKFSDPYRVSDDIDELIEIYPDKEIAILEIGFATSEYLDSSEQNQAIFIQEVFKSWDKHSNIKTISFLRLHDWSEDVVHGTQAMREFLRTLGLRTYQGEDKLGFIQLKEELDVRGW